jgi:hypothetical protein
VHLVVSSRARVKHLADLKGKRVAIDAPSSATNLTVRSILTGAKLKAANLKLSFQSPADAAVALKAGKIDAFFVIGAAPLHLVDELVTAGDAKLLPIDGAPLAAWLKKQPFLSPVDLPPGTYHGSKATRTVAVTALWVATAQLPDTVAYSLTRALWNPANRPEIDSLGAVGASIRRDGPLVSSAVPLHAGAAKFYKNAGRVQN